MAAVRCTLGRWQSFALRTGLDFRFASMSAVTASPTGGDSVSRGVAVGADQPAFDDHATLRVENDERTRLGHLLCVPGQGARFECLNRGGDDVQFGLDPFAFLAGVFIVLRKRVILFREFVLPGGQCIHIALFVLGIWTVDRIEAVVAIQFEHVPLNARFGPVPSLGTDFGGYGFDFFARETLQQFGIGDEIRRVRYR